MSTSSTLNGNPALLDYIPGTHALHYVDGGDRKNVKLHVRGDYPQTGDLEIEIAMEEPARFPLVLRVPEWAEGFEAKVDGKIYKPSHSNRLLKIKREWSPGDTVQVKAKTSSHTPWFTRESKRKVKKRQVKTARRKNTKSE